jgi:hypothetical protein
LNSPNIKNEEWVYIENNLNLKTPLLIVLVFGTLEWIIEEGWPVLLKRNESDKRILEVDESSISRNTVNNHSLGLFEQ